MKTRSGAQGRIRTTDTRIFSPLLYQLSYLGVAVDDAGLWDMRHGPAPGKALAYRKSHAACREAARGGSNSVMRDAPP